MRGPLASLITVAAATALVGTFYAHTLLSLPAHAITPIVTAGVAGCLGILALLGVLSLRLVATAGAARQLSVWMLYLAVIFCTLSTLRGAIRQAMTPADLGVFVVQVGTPVLLLFCVDRVALLRAACRVAVLFALADLTVNLLSLFKVADIAAQVGVGSSYGVHFLGLPGNSFAEGLVAFVAISYVAAGVPYSRNLQWIGRMLLIAALFGSEWMIRARTDMGISVVAVALLCFRNSHRIPAVAVAAGVSAILLFATFHAAPGNDEERLRGDMMHAGLDRALEHPILGTGIRYRDTQDLVANYRSLRDGGVTESGTLDYAIAYGWIATVCLYLSCFLALAAPRLRQTYPAVLLACLAGAMATTGGLENFLGSVAFYAALIICQREEWWSVQVARRAL